MLVSLQPVGVAGAPLNVTVLVPCVAPKFVPVIVTEVPTGPVVGDTLVMLGGGTTVKFTPLLAKPPTVTMTISVVAPFGTGATMLVSLQLVGAAGVPLNVTAFVPCVAPKFVPAIVTGVPTCPDVGDKLVTVGGGTTVNDTPLLAPPLVVTITLPVVAPLGTSVTIPVSLQLVGEATVPLNVTVLVPCVPPKFVPAIVTTVPTGPDAGLRLVIVGGGAWVKLIVAAADFVGSATDVAVSVTAGGVGAINGAL